MTCCKERKDLRAITNLQFKATLEFVEQNPDDLALIHQFAASDTTLDDFYIVKAVAVNDKPIKKDDLLIVVSPEMQISFIPVLAGLPFVKDHSNATKDSLGFIFSAEVEESNGVTSSVIHAALPLGAGSDEDIAAIRKGKMRQVSMGFKADPDSVELIRLDDGSEAIKLLPSDKTYPQEVSLVGLGACGADCRIAAKADIPLGDVLETDSLSPMDRECLLFGKQMKQSLIDAVVTYERQLNLISDMKLAAESYANLTPYNLQDKRDSLLKLLKSNEQKDSQRAVESDWLSAQVKDEGDEEPTMTAKEIAQEMKGNNDVNSRYSYRRSSN